MWVAVEHVRMMQRQWIIILLSSHREYLLTVAKDLCVDIIPLLTAPPTAILAAGVMASLYILLSESPTTNGGGKT